MNNQGKVFDAHEKEQQLRQEASRWDTSQVSVASETDIPTLDLSDYFTTGTEEALQEVASQLRIACEEVGFFYIVGHQIPGEQFAEIFAKVRQFHDLPLETKQTIPMDSDKWPVGGVGYLPLQNRKLPSRNTGNLNESFIIKCNHQLTFDDNQWPDETMMPGFRSTVEDYADTMKTLGKRLLPVFATALDMPPDFFDEAFHSPFFRLRMTHYPPPDAKIDNGQHYGIAPHVDTSFCTILAQDRPGLTLYSERRQCWVQAPCHDDTDQKHNALIVNVGELLRQWTNDRFLSVKHFANNTSDTSRYSIPFFFNAHSHYTMECIPSCCSEPDNPAKYPPVSYSESQGVVQGE